MNGGTNSNKGGGTVLAKRGRTKATGVVFLTDEGYGGDVKGSEPSSNTM